MMYGKPEQERVQALLSEAVAMLCRSSIEYKSHFTLQGLLGITVDEDKVLLIELKDTIKNPEADNNSDTETTAAEVVVKSPARSKRKSRRRSRSGSASPGSESPMGPPAKKQTIVIPDEDPVCVKQERFSSEEVPQSQELPSYEANPAFSQSGQALPHLASMNQTLEEFPNLAPPQDVPVPGCSKWEGAGDGQEENVQLPSIPVTKYGIFGSLPMPYSRQRGMVGMFPPFANQSSLSPNMQSAPQAVPASSPHSGRMSSPSSRSTEPESSSPSSPSVRKSGSGYRPSPNKCRIKQTLLLMQGCVVTARMFCRKKGLLIQDVLDAMTSLSVDASHPAYCGVYVYVSNHTHLFYKCPPHMVQDQALEQYNIKRAEYTRWFYQNPRPARGGPVNWPMYVEMLLSNSPYPKRDFPLESMGLSGNEYAALEKSRMQATLREDQGNSLGSATPHGEETKWRKSQFRKRHAGRSGDSETSSLDDPNALCIDIAGQVMHDHKQFSPMEPKEEFSDEVERGVDNGDIQWQPADINQLDPDSIVDHTETVDTCGNTDVSTPDNPGCADEDDEESGIE